MPDGYCIFFYVQFFLKDVGTDESLLRTEMMKQSSFFLVSIFTGGKTGSLISNLM